MLQQSRRIDIVGPHQSLASSPAFAQASQMHKGNVGKMILRQLCPGIAHDT